jgi:hypothetical protein
MVCSHLDEVAFEVDTPTGATRIPPSPMLS